MSKKKIIGIAGKPGSGKTTVAGWLHETYSYYTLEGSEFLRQKARDNRMELVTREDYSDLHRQLQKKSSKTVMIDYLLGLPHSNVALIGIRSGYNAEKIQSNGGIVIYLDAPVELRYKRKRLNKDFKIKSLTDFIAQEEQQMSSKDGLGADLKSVFDRADYIIDTSGSLEKTQHTLKEILTSQNM